MRCGKGHDRQTLLRLPLQVAAKDGVDLHQCQHSVKDFSLAGLSGDYRRIVHRPKDLTWQIMHYSDPLDDSIVATDYEELTGSRPGKRARQEGGEAGRQQQQGQAAQQQKQQQDASPAATEGQQKEAPPAGPAGPSDAAAEHQQNEHGQTQQQAAEEADGTSKASAGSKQPSQLLGLLLTFKLPSSCYATMLLREITKSSTAKSFQKTLATE
jgi:tRNA pseudouridine13 synthase